MKALGLVWLWRVMFQCDKCGCCCCAVGTNPLYKELDRGDGICRYYDISTKLCSIYNERPLFCNIDARYDIYFQNVLSRDDYYKINHVACEKLRAAVNKK